MNSFSLNIHFTERAAKLLPPSQPSFQLPGLDASSQRSLAVGDHLRIEDIPNCPWFVVAKRYWSLAANKASLTLWLDEPID